MPTWPPPDLGVRWRTDGDPHTDVAWTATGGMVERRRETRVTTERVDLFVCPSCKQRYEDEQMVCATLGAEVAEDGSEASYSEVTALCENCANSVFGYTGPKGSVPTAEELERGAPDDEQDGSRLGWKSIVATAMVHPVGLFAGSGAEDAGLFLLEDAFSAVFFLSWLLVPALVYWDMQYVSRNSAWKPSLLWLLPLSVWFLNVPVALFYIARRNDALQRAADADGDGTAPDGSAPERTDDAEATDDRETVADTAR